MTITLTASDICTDLRRCQAADTQTLETVASLYGVHAKDIAPLLQSLKECGIVEGTTFRTDVWARVSSIGHIPETSVRVRQLLPYEIMIDDRNRHARSRYDDSRRRQQVRKEEVPYDLYFMAGI